MVRNPLGEGQKFFPFFFSVWFLFSALVIFWQPVRVQSADGEKLTLYDRLAEEATLLNKRGQFDRVLSLLKPHQNDPRNESSLFFNELGIAYQNLGRLPEAGQAFRQALDRDPQNPAVANNLGYVFYLQKNFPRAVEAYQKVLESNPRFMEAHANLSLAFYQQQRYEEALGEIETVLKLEPGYQAAQKFREKILRKLKEKKGSSPPR